LACRSQRRIDFKRLDDPYTLYRDDERYNLGHRNAENCWAAMMGSRCMFSNLRASAMRSKNGLHDTATPAQSPTPAADDPQPVPQPKPRFTHEDWKRKVLQDMNDLDGNPGRVLALRKRIF
jgi:hypothetical protein